MHSVETQEWASGYVAICETCGWGGPVRVYKTWADEDATDHVKNMEGDELDVTIAEAVALSNYKWTRYEGGISNNIEYELEAKKGLPFLIQPNKNIESVVLLQERDLVTVSADLKPQNIIDIIDLTVTRMEGL